MRLSFPYGKAPLCILVLALVAGGVHLAAEWSRDAKQPDLVFAIFAPNHREMYEAALPAFEREHGVEVQLQLVSTRALKSRLQAALLTGADVPDLVELVNPSMGYFTRGPLADVGFVDLTERLEDEGIRARMVESRFSLWSSRGHVFALPHDVHPVALCYRRDLVAELGIDVEALRTWDEFAAMGRRITADLDGDGVPDRYALDLPANAGATLRLLLLQRGEHLFDAAGRVAFDTPGVADTIVWYIRQTRGSARIAYGAGGGQSLSKAMVDGLVLFYFCPDWRTKQFEMDVPGLAGKLGLVPLPAWEPGGRRTSTWGGTGLAITKACPRQELAWELAKYLYLSEADLGERFRRSNIIPPLRDAWDLDAFAEERPFWGGQAIGELYAELATETPDDYVSPYTELATTKLNEAYLNAAHRFESRGEEGLRAYALAELERVAAYVRRIAARNVFHDEAAGEEP